MTKSIIYFSLFLSFFMPLTIAEEVNPGYTYAVFRGSKTFSEYDSYGRLNSYTITYVSNPIKVDLSKYTLDHAKIAFDHKIKSSGHLILETPDRSSIYKELRVQYPDLMKRGRHKKVTVSTSYVKRAKEGKLKDSRR